MTYIMSESEKKRGYSDKTDRLIKEMIKVNLKQDKHFNRQKITAILKKAYKVAGLPMPKIKVVRIDDKGFLRGSVTGLI